MEIYHQLSQWSKVRATEFLNMPLAASREVSVSVYVLTHDHIHHALYIAKSALCNATLISSHTVALVGHMWLMHPSLHQRAKQAKTVSFRKTHQNLACLFLSEGPFNNPRQRPKVPWTIFDRIGSRHLFPDKCAKSNRVYQYKQKCIIVTQSYGFLSSPRPWWISLSTQSAIYFYFSGHNVKYVTATLSCYMTRFSITGDLFNFPILFFCISSTDSTSSIVSGEGEGEGKDNVCSSVSAYTRKRVLETNFQLINRLNSAHK